MTKNDFKKNNKKGNMQMYPAKEAPILSPYRNALKISVALSVSVR